jgi:hypothetical protein
VTLLIRQGSEFYGEQDRRDDDDLFLDDFALTARTAATGETAVPAAAGRPNSTPEQGTETESRTALTSSITSPAGGSEPAGRAGVDRAARYAAFKPLHDEGLNSREIAERCGVSRTLVRDVLNDPDGSKHRVRRQRQYRKCTGCGGRCAPTAQHCIDCSPHCQRQVLESKYTVVDAGHDTPCWRWDRRLDRDGYGRTTFRSQRGYLAHRAAYELIIGPIADGLTLDHLCLNPACVNPAHLEPVTRDENARRGHTTRHQKKSPRPLHTAPGS